MVVEVDLKMPLHQEVLLVGVKQVDLAVEEQVELYLKLVIQEEQEIHLLLVHLKTIYSRCFHWPNSTKLWVFTSPSSTKWKIFCWWWRRWCWW